MKKMFALIALTFTISAAEDLGLDGRAAGLSPKVFVRDTTFSTPTLREVSFKAPPAKESKFLVDGFDYHQEEIKPWDILMEGNVDFRVDGL